MYKSKKANRPRSHTLVLRNVEICNQQKKSSHSKMCLPKKLGPQAAPKKITCLIKMMENLNNLRILGMSWGVKNTFFEAPGVSLGGSGVSIGGVKILTKNNPHFRFIHPSFISLPFATKKPFAAISSQTSPSSKSSSISRTPLMIASITPDGKARNFSRGKRGRVLFGVEAEAAHGRRVHKVANKQLR